MVVSRAACYLVYFGYPLFFQSISYIIEHILRVHVSQHLQEWDEGLVSRRGGCSIMCIVPF